MARSSKLISIAVLIAMLIAIPLFSLFVALKIRGSLEAKYPIAACATAEGIAELGGLCDLVNNMERLRNGSLGAILTALASVAAISLAGFVGRYSRFFLLLSFRVGLVLTQFVVVALVVGNAVLTVMSIYYGEAYLFGRVHYGLLLGIGIVAVVAVLQVALVALTGVRAIHAQVLGRAISREDHPDLWAFVEKVAREAGTTPPDHIVVGLDPGFFVTEAKVDCVSGTLKGRTLFVSLPFCRVISRSELGAILGHEMAHFVGLDTQFSRSFFPVYRGAATTLFALGSHFGPGGSGLGALALLPAISLMSHFLMSFAEAEGAISRSRELTADALGAKLTSREVMGAALIKAHGYGSVWGKTEAELVVALNRGQQIGNVGELFERLVRMAHVDALGVELTKTRTAHPTDSHPPLDTRLEALGLKFSTHALTPASDDSAIRLFSVTEALEKELSEYEHAKLVHLGVVVSVPAVEQKPAA